MASPSPEQQSAARQMKQVKLNKSAKPGKLDKHGASLARRSALSHRAAVQKINLLIAQIRWSAISRLRQGYGEQAERAQNATGTSRLQELLKKLAALLKQLADALFSPLAQALGGGGGGASTLRGAYSGCDPPHVPFHAGTNNSLVEKAKQPMGWGKKALLMGSLAMLASYAVPMKADASLIRDVEFNQNGGGSLATLYLQNNDSGVTYDSAELKFDELLDGVAESVKANNSLYTSKTLDEIKSEWNFGLDPSAGDIYTGWSTALNGSVLNFTNIGGIPNLTYDTWTDLLNNNEAALTVDFKDQLDFNHNGQYDSALEQLSWTGVNVEDAFTGYDGGGLDYSSDANALNIVPEPVTIGLMGLGGVLALAARRLGDYGSKTGSNRQNDF